MHSRSESLGFMVEEFRIFGRSLTFRSRETSFRAYQALWRARMLNFLTSRKFSAGENLLYSLAADSYQLAAFFAPHDLTPKVIRQMQLAAEHFEVGSAIEPPTLQQLRFLGRGEANELSHPIMAPEHLLLSVLRHEPKSAALLAGKGIHYDEVRKAVEKGLSSQYIEIRIPRVRFYEH
jgi:hypothetical protein